MSEKQIKEALIFLAKCIDDLERPHLSETLSKDFQTREESLKKIILKGG